MNNKPYIIGITGGSGSGKTSFLHKLSESFSEEDICILSTDNYYRPSIEQEADELGIANYDLPGSLYRDELERDILQLLEGKNVEREEYTFNNPHVKARQLLFKSAPVLILEGIFVFHYPEILELIDLKVYVYTNESTALSRRIRRDKVERNYPLEDVLYRYENHVMPTFRKYIEPVRDMADVIINNNKDFEKGLEVMKGFIQNRLVRV
jgi:uridine kinase